MKVWFEDGEPKMVEEKRFEYGFRNGSRPTTNFYRNEKILVVS